MALLSLHSHHERRGARFDPREGYEVLKSFGSADDEYGVLRSAAGLLDFSARELLRVVGEDRDSFIHGMVTQDVKGLAPNRATYAAMVTAKGAMVADARIWKHERELWIEVEPGLGAKVREFLEKYLISEDAELSDLTPERALLGLWGPEAGKVFEAACGAPMPGKDELRQVKCGEVELFVVGDPQVAGSGVVLAVPRASLETVYDALTRAGATPVGEDAAEMIRVEAGVPRYGRDMDDATIPLEAELQRAISYNKGCYIGQEVIARATYRGHMNRKLTGLLLTGEPVAPKTELRLGDRKVGWVTTAVRIPGRPQTIALGYVHRNHLEPGTTLTVGPAEQAAAQTASVQPLPFAPKA